MAGPRGPLAGYTLAAPAADPFVRPRADLRPTPARIRSTELYVCQMYLA